MISFKSNSARVFITAGSYMIYFDALALITGEYYWIVNGRNQAISRVPCLFYRQIYAAAITTETEVPMLLQGYCSC